MTTLLNSYTDFLFHLDKSHLIFQVIDLYIKWRSQSTHKKCMVLVLEVSKLNPIKWPWVIFFYILEYLEAIQNSLAAHNREPQEMVTALEATKRLPRSWWRCQKARKMMATFFKLSEGLCMRIQSLSPELELDVNLNFPLLPTFPLVKAYCFEATYWGVALLNNLDTLSPSYKVPAFIDTFQLGGGEDWREKCWFPQQKAQRGQVRVGTKEEHLKVPQRKSKDHEGRGHPWSPATQYFSCIKCEVLGLLKP